MSMIRREPVRRTAQAREPPPPSFAVQTMNTRGPPDAMVLQECFLPNTNTRRGAYRPAFFIEMLSWSRRISVNIAWGAMRT